MTDRENCPMRHENGNCLPHGGFCLAVKDETCEALHNAFQKGRYTCMIEIAEIMEKRIGTGGRAMSDREKLVELISECRCVHVTGEESKATIEVNSWMLADHLIAHGVTVKQMQKPLTVEEIKKMASEIEGHGWPLDDVPPILCLEFREEGRTLWVQWSVAVDALVLKNMESILRSDYTYNREWRLWLRKPTDEERKAAEWL